MWARLDHGSDGWLRRLCGTIGNSPPTRREIQLGASFYDITMAIGGHRSFGRMPRVESEPQPIVGASPQIADLRRRIQSAAITDESVLIVGEPGTGKELVARQIWSRSRRSEHPFTAINFAALPQTLIEVALFGKRDAAFGCYRNFTSKLELADRGILFLDELGDLNLQMQSALLRFIESHEVRRVGAGPDDVRRVDVRMISATPLDLRKMVADGSFREDLFYRLGQVEISVPPVREHPEDIPVLLESFLARGNSAVRLPDKTMSELMQYEWPGNVREIQSVAERLLLDGSTGIQGPVVSSTELRGNLRSVVVEGSSLA